MVPLAIFLTVPELISNRASACKNNGCFGTSWHALIRLGWITLVCHPVLLALNPLYTLLLRSRIGPSNPYLEPPCTRDAVGSGSLRPARSIAWALTFPPALLHERGAHSTPDPSKGETQPRHPHRSNPMGHPHLCLSVRTHCLSGSRAYRLENGNLFGGVPCPGSVMVGSALPSTRK